MFIVVVAVIFLFFVVDEDDYKNDDDDDHHHHHHHHYTQTHVLSLHGYKLQVNIVYTVSNSMNDKMVVGQTDSWNYT